MKHFFLHFPHNKNAHTCTRAHMTGAAKLLHVQAHQHASLDGSMIYCNRQVRGHRVDLGGARATQSAYKSQRSPRAPPSTPYKVVTLCKHKAQPAYKQLAPFIWLAQSRDDADRSSWP